jgi:hypothetical protein
VHIDAAACASIDAARTEGAVRRATADGRAFEHPAFRELF